jgi:hypothetical protein
LHVSWKLKTILCCVLERWEVIKKLAFWPWK